jgi:uncharacterized OsmC-like protein
VGFNSALFFSTFVSYNTELSNSKTNTMTQLRFSIGGESRNATRLYADASGFKVAVDHSEDRGGRTNAPSPFEYILAGYAGCLNAVCHMVAKEMGILIHKLFVEVSGEINTDRTNGRSFKERAGFQNIDVDIQVYSDSDEEVLSRWLEVVETRCPIYDTLVNPTPVSLNVHKLECVYY